MDKTLSSIDDGTVKFIEAWPPPLEAGDYQISVSQTVTLSTSQSETIPKNTYSFSVAAPRFTLDPALIHSFFPPPAHRGHFSSYLPQVVFARRTLAWERTLDDSQPARGTVTPPWMGVLLIDETETVPEVQSMPIGNVLSV